MSRTASKKVLILHNGGGIGGAPVSLLQMVARLDRALYTPKIIFSEPGAMIDLADREGVATGLLPMRGAFVYGAHVPIRPRTLVPTLVGFRGTIAGARSLLRAERPDLVHLNTSALLPLGVAARREGIPIVWHVREVVNPGTPVGRWLSGRIFQMADQVIAVSHYVAAGLPDGDKVSVVHNPVDTSHFDPAGPGRAAVRAELGIGESDFVVGILGSVQRVKGHFVLADAARRLIKTYPNAKFMVVGGGAPEGYEQTWKGRAKRSLGLALDNEEKLRRVIAQYRMAGSFRFCGYHSDVAPYVAAMDVVAVPALRPEGCPRPLLEGMAMAKPVVATDIGPSREILGDATAIFCPPGEPDTLARALTRLASDPELAAGMGRAGRERAVKAFDIDGHVRAVTDVYESVVGTHEAVQVPVG